MITALMRPRCRIPLGEPDESGLVWDRTEVLPALVTTWPDFVKPVRTEVRGLAGERALHLRFDCFLEDPARLRPRVNTQALTEGEHVAIEVWERNDPVASWVVLADFRGVTEATRHRRMTGENSLEAVPDLWVKSAAEKLASPGQSVFHGLCREKWWAEVVLPWRALGLAQRPAVIGLRYSRVFQTGRAWPERADISWPEAKRASSVAAVLEPGEALIGPEACAPERIEMDALHFGVNSARMILGADRGAADTLAVWTEAPDGSRFGQGEFPIRGERVDFRFEADRRLSSHAGMFTPQRLVVEMRASARSRVLYRASLPQDRHLGVCVDEPYGLARQPADAATPRPGRDEWLDRIARALPRLERRNTTQGASSDFCLVSEDGRDTINLMADDTWDRLAAVVESRFQTAEDRLVAAMALVAQKSVTNLILGPMFMTPDGDQHYHSCLHEMMGPLSIMRYGGGPAVARAAVLARLLRQVRDPATGRPFVTRLVSLTQDGGPRQVTRGYVKGNLAPFWQHPGVVGAVAVDYADSQTLLDPTALAFFPAAGGRLLTIEQTLADPAARIEGAGRLADIYGKVDPDEIRRHRPDRTLSKGVFPELCPDEDRPDRPMDHRERQVLRCLVAPPSRESSAEAGFVDVFGDPGRRDAAVFVRHDARGLHVRVRVRGVELGVLDDRDRAIEQVHVAVDEAHGHIEFWHFVVNAAGRRDAWRESAGGIQRLFKHLNTDSYTLLRDMGPEGWEASLTPCEGGYEAAFRLPWAVLDVEAAPPVMGLNAWVDGRRPEYEQVFLCPPRWQVAADPFTFADLYLTDAPAVLAEIDLDVPTWGDNTASVVVRSRSTGPVRVVVQAHQSLNATRSVRRLAEVEVVAPANDAIRFAVPFFVDPRVKMGAQTIGLSARVNAKEMFRCEWQTSYCYPLSVYQRYGRSIPACENPRPGDRDYLDRKIRYICSMLPRLRRLTTRDGAASDFVLRAEDGSVEFNLMQAGVLDRMGEYVAGLFDNDLDRVLGVFYLSYHPAVARHMSWGHRIMQGAGPLTVIRGNFAGGGGNCGYHARAFAGMAAHLRLGGKPLAAHTVGIWGHVVAAVGYHGGKVLLDPDVGHFLMTPDGSDLATIEEFRANPSLLTTAGPDDLARLYTFDDARVRDYPGIRDEEFQGVWPPGAPKA